ncbi:hypothetical protein ACFSHP_27040 [Novosphingobium panipatense]
MAEELATSRIPVRDALRILEARGSSRCGPMQAPA